MQLKGKQIKDNSVEQNKLNVTTESITNISSVTNAEYINTNSVNRVESLNYATLNMNMLANNATIGDLACDIPIIEFPISNTQVKINNINVTVGVGKDCYFSPDGIEIRTGGQAEKDDLLYWNSTRFNLESDDEIDFIYITAKETLELAENTTITLDPYYPALNVKYTGTDGTSMNITIDGVSFTVGNVAGDFVWDIGGVNETTMTIKGESIVQVVNGEDYTIWFDGFGSLLYSVKKGLFDIEIISIFGTGFDEECSKVLNLDDGRILAIGKFTEYNGNPFDGIVLLNKNGTVDNTFIQGTGFDNSAGIGNSPVFNNMIQDTDGKIVIIGYFTEYNGSAINGIIRLNIDGTIDNTLIQGTGFIGSGNSIIEDSNGKYVIGGNVTSYNGVSVKKAFRILKDGSIDSTFNTLAGFNGTVNVIIEDTNNQYIFGGVFTEFNTYTIVSLVRLNQDGSIDPTLVTSNGGLEGGVSTIIEDSDGNYMIGGDMTLYDRVTWVNGVIRIAKNGDVITSFVQGTGFNDTVKTVIEYDNKYYFGGRFTEYNDTKVKSFVVLNKDGSIDTQFNTNLSTDLSDYMVVNDMKLLSNNNICICGNFHIYNEYVSNKIAIIKGNGDIDSSKDKLKPSFYIRMTIDGNLGGFTAGTYILTPTWTTYTPYYDGENMRFLTNDISIHAFLDEYYYTSYSYSVKDALYLVAKSSNGNTTVKINTDSSVTSTQYPGFMSNDPLFFKTYNLGNGVTMTLEKVVV